MRSSGSARLEQLSGRVAGITSHCDAQGRVMCTRTGTSARTAKTLELVFDLWVDARVRGRTDDVAGGGDQSHLGADDVEPVPAAARGRAALPASPHAARSHPA